MEAVRAAKIKDWGVGTVFEEAMTFQRGAYLEEVERMNVRFEGLTFGEGRFEGFTFDIQQKEITPWTRPLLNELSKRISKAKRNDGQVYRLYAVDTDTGDCDGAYFLHRWIHVFVELDYPVKYAYVE